MKDGAESFGVTVIEAVNASCAVLFAVGGGGNPNRHLPLLMNLAKEGCYVVAPHFSRLVSPIPNESDLLLRARRLCLALDSVNPALRVIGVGHSIGATMLLALAGGQAWMDPDRQLCIKSDSRLSKLVLLAPALDFFRAPGALAAVHKPISVWYGTEDKITPSIQGEVLKQGVPANTQIESNLIKGAGHFSFMNELPPQVTDSLLNREEFLSLLTDKVCHFVLD